MPKRYTSNWFTLHNFREYWDELRSQSKLDADREENWIKRAEFLDQVSMDKNVPLFLYNAHTNRFLYMSDKLRVLSGLDPSLYTAENGIEFSFSRFHPEQVEGLMQFTQFVLRYFSEHKLYGNKNAFITNTFLHKNSLNNYVQLIQRSVILEVDEHGQPLLILNFLHSVGHVIKYGTMNAVISTSDKVNIYYYNTTDKAIETPVTFSDHERKIIQMLAQGADSKAIAKDLFISPHTVDNHRRNLIKKTSCIDTTGVVAFAQLVNLI